MRELLACSVNYKLYGSYEEAQLEGKDIIGHKIIGDFYGNVDCACIDKNEKWIVLGGNGLIIYKLEQPFEEYSYNRITNQWKELWREDIRTPWYPEVIYQVDANTVRLVIDLTSDVAGIYELNVNTFIHNKIA